jgi:hypothetical protein
MRRKKRESGAAFVELAFMLPFLATLFIGVSGLGIRLLESLTVTQVARDAASMYSRGTDFSSNAPVNQALLSRLGTTLGWPQTTALGSTDRGVIYLSQIMYVDNTCNGNALVDAKGRACNTNSWVFLNTIVIGNTSVHSSNFGAPPSCISACYDSVISGASPNLGNINLTEAYYNSGDVVRNFNYLGTPSSGTAGFQPGQPANLVEVASYVGQTVDYAFALY